MNTSALRKTWEGQVAGGKFPLRQWIGSSDHSVVFLTELEGTSQRAAIKLIPASTLNVGQLARWKPALNFSHPHLLRVFDIGRCELDRTPLCYIVMEYAEEDLMQILPQRPLSTTELGELLSPVLDALSYLHGKGFVHGAIKPANVHAVDDRLKLSVDRMYPVGQASDKVLARTVYDAPEFATAGITPAADIWSLGITIVEALTQVPPATLGTREPVVPNTVPEPFQGIARACLQRDPAHRCSVADIRARIRFTPTVIPASLAVPVSQQPHRRSMLVPAVVVASVLAAGLLGQRLFSHRDTGSSPQTTVAADKPAPQSAPMLPPKQAPARENSVPQKTSEQAVHQVLPEVPKSARNTIQGKIKVVVRVNVDSSGKVTAATLTSPGPSQYFANLALKAARQWEFPASLVKGEATPSTWNIRFQFGRTATKAFPAQVSAR